MMMGPLVWGGGLVGVASLGTGGTEQCWIPRLRSSHPMSACYCLRWPRHPETLPVHHGSADPHAVGPGRTGLWEPGRVATWSMAASSHLSGSAAVAWERDLSHSSSGRARGLLMKGLRLPTSYRASNLADARPLSLRRRIILADAISDTAR